MEADGARAMVSDCASGFANAVVNDAGFAHEKRAI